MDELQIPDEAWAAAMEAAQPRFERSDIVAAAVVAAAPHIVAAELRELVGRVDAIAEAAMRDSQAERLAQQLADDLVATSNRLEAQS